MGCARFAVGLLVAALAGCGGATPGAPRMGVADIVPVPAGMDVIGADRGADAGTDLAGGGELAGDAPEPETGGPDLFADGGEDVPGDPGSDPADVAFTDEGGDSGPEVAADTTDEAVADAPLDSASDVEPDATIDAGPDAPIDIASDAAIDIAPDVTALCLESSCILCRPCRTDADCNPQGGVANACIAYGDDGSFCGIPCATDGACPSGTACDGEFGGWHCRAIGGGGCPCLEGLLGYATACSVTNEFGACPGERTCDQACQGPAPAREVCDGVDNDCDGATDGDDSLQCGTGACAASVIACVNGLPQSCVPGLPSPETCNLVDDDCDGLTDEDLGSVSCGVGACMSDAPACVDGAPGTCVPGVPAVEVCNGLDDDCDGSTDEDLGTVTCGIGPCTTTVDACADGAPSTCVPGPPLPETCNGEDDDCDGAVDEDLGQTTCGIGPCARTVDTCVAGQIQACVPGPVPAGTCDAAPAYCHETTTGLDACGNPCTKVGPDKCFTVHPACLTSGPGQPTDVTQCTTPKGKYDCGLTCQPFANTIGADCTYCWNILCNPKPGKDEAQFQCNNIPMPPTS